MGNATRVTAADMIERLRRHYLKPGALPGGMFVPEVGINGPMRQQRCDAVYVGFTNTNGRLLIGHEVKVTRADWRHELDKPHKADRWADQCHAWYVVAPSTDVVPPEELPPGWGLLTINPRTTTRLDKTVRATVHDEREPAWWALRSVMARNDTLMWGAIEDRARHLAESRIADSRRRDAEASARIRSADADLAAKLRKLRADLGREHVYATDDELLATVAAVMRDRSAYDGLQHQVTEHLRTLRSITAPLSEYLGPLAALDRQLREEQPS